MAAVSTARLQFLLSVAIALLAIVNLCVYAQGVSTLDDRNDKSIMRAQSHQNVHDTATESADAPTGNMTKPTGTRDLEAITDKLADVAALFQMQFETRLSQLMSAPYVQGKAVHVPWPGDYWPLVNGGINHKWNPGQPSPAEKYALAYGLDVKALTNLVFLSSGVFTLGIKRTPCSTQAQCGVDVCVVYMGVGVCVATWEGLCHAWAPAAILEPEPQCAFVTANGIRFEPRDIKALLTHSYLDSRTQALNGQGILGTGYAGLDTSQDKFGRYNQLGLRDVNPGAFHIVLTNLMGKLGSSFVIDRTTGSEVWNQPLRDYKVLQWKRYTVADGATAFFSTAQYPFNPLAANLALVKTEVRWIEESVGNGPLLPAVDKFTGFQIYDYLLELDVNDNIIGGEWLLESVKNHPDFLWFVGAKPLLNSVVGGVN